jgi:hypothetical protein
MRLNSSRVVSHALLLEDSAGEVKCWQLVILTVPCRVWRETFSHAICLATESTATGAQQVRRICSGGDVDHNACWQNDEPQTISRSRFRSRHGAK